MLVIPAGQEIEYQGYYTFFTQILAPVPSAWFVFCEDTNLGGENNSMKFGLASLIVFYMIAFVILVPLFDEKKAAEKAQATMHLRIRGKEMVKGAKVAAAGDV
jgi:hypothetical protein